MRLAAQEEIARHAHQRHQRQILVDRGDAACRACPAASRSAIGLAVDQNFALVGHVHAGQNLDQRRFAGAIVAKQAMDFAGPDVEGHVLERDDRAEILADRLELDEGRCHQRLLMARLRT